MGVRVAAGAPVDGGTVGFALVETVGAVGRLAAGATLGATLPALDGAAAG
ncbi:MAG: hypothetical protein ACJ796_18030 [Gemmatimonadaceae bacterium]